ncbi:hypothetical protein [Domibacillus epiphyticus]|uniref:Uncharacterized protein n=1 Tax=Domibacillus epiphyticus TaxID=1714355 RepID=A0A1V2A3V3_9BACI|nr:hypothetical protein [Domibacillus epiphyticus]OMP65688.1 hypothetical protein BTO28_16165 [Domibacillus epiphyticus]
MTNWKEAYVRLWKGRSIANIEEAMENELLDKMNHPRLRKKVELKFFESVRRVNASELTDAEKLELISAYITCMEKLKEND